MVINRCNELHGVERMDGRAKLKRYTNNWRTHEYVDLYVDLHGSRWIGKSIRNDHCKSAAANRDTHSFAIHSE